MRRLGVLGLLLMMSPAGAGTDNFNSAGHILPGCKLYSMVPGVGTQLFDQGRCMGLLNGLVTATEWIEPYSRFCSYVPGNTTNAQLAAVVARYIEARPNRCHEDFKTLALEAFADAWPCGDASTSETR